MLTFSGFTGINNQAPEHRLGKTDLLQAVNVDIGNTGDVMRRSGYVLQAQGCYSNLHQASAYLLAVCDGQLVALHDSGARFVIHPALGTDRVWYCDLPDGRCTYSNGLIHGVTDGFADHARSVVAPVSLGFADPAFGALTPGTYRYHLTHRRLSDGMESPAVSSEPVELLQGGLRLDGLRVLDGHELLVYLSTPDGTGAYLAGSATSATYEYGGNNSQLVLPCRTLGAVAFPVGTVTAFWRGRVLVALPGGLLAASRPMAPHLADWSDFKQFQGEITAIQPVSDGVYVGTTQDLIFLSGTQWDQLAYVPTKRGAVVLGSGVEAPGNQLKYGDGTGQGLAMVCIAGGEVVAGFGGGQTQGLTEERYRTTVREVSAAWRDLHGIPQYMAVSV